MARRKVSMKNIREILRLYESGYLSKRKIAKALGMSHPVVIHYLAEFKGLGLKYNDIYKMPDNELLDLFSQKTRANNERYKTLKNCFEYITTELKRPGVTLQLLWEEYLKKHPDGYGRSQFFHHFHVWRNSSRLTMHIEHKAGDRMFADFTGRKMYIFDRQKNNFVKQEVFVATLGGSNLTYVEAVGSQKKEDWIKVNENAMHYFGGVPRAITPDNLKSAVSKADKYEPDINPEYMDFCRHYGTTILPARPRRPKDKALVENAVRIVYRWIFATLRNQTFYSLKELNEAISVELEKYNLKPMQQIKISRRELFEQVESSELLPLPAKKYEFKTFKKQKVQFNYHIYLSDDKHYYSVPYRFRGRDVELIYSQRVVEIYYNNCRIALHLRTNGPDRYTTLSEHMPPNHKWIVKWTPRRFKNWAKDIGPNTHIVIKQILDSCNHPVQGFKSCLGILNMPKKYGDARVEKACKRAIEFKYYSCKGIKKILDNKLEDIQDELDLFSNPFPVHENVRGSSYYS